MARQMFGARGLSQFYQFNANVYIQAIETLVSIVDEAIEDDLDITKLSDLFSKVNKRLCLVNIGA